METAPGTSGPPVIRDFFPNWVNLYGAPPEADYAAGMGSALVAYAMNHGGRCARTSSNPNKKQNPTSK